MVYLQELLRHIYPDELQKIKALEKTELETRVFDFVLQNKKEFSVAEAAGALEISEVHFRKIHSQFLQKAYNVFAPNGGLPLLRFLARRSLHNQVKHELHKLEKQMLENQDREGLKELFYYSTELFLNSDLSKHHPNYVEELCKKYSEYAKDEPKFKLLIPQLQLLYYQETLQSRKYGLYNPRRVEFFKKVGRRLDEFKKHLLASDDPRAHFWYYYHLAHYYETGFNDHEKVRENLLQAIAVYNQNPDKFSDYYKKVTSLNLAMNYYDSSKLSEAYQQFKNTFTTYPETMKESIFYTDAFIQLNIALAQYEEAKALLFEIYRFDREKPYAYNGKNFAPLSVLGLVYLLEESYELGYKCIQTAQQLCVKSNFYYLEALIRILENSYFVFVENYELALQLTDKNIKFHKYKEAGEEGAFFISFHKLIRAFIKNKFESKRPSNKLAENFKGWQKAEFAFIGQLLHKIKDQMGLENWPAESK